MDGSPLQARAVRRQTDMEAQAMVGTVLDRRYRLDELVGRGGMAYVFRATHTLIGKTLAVKVVRPDLAGDPDIVERFLREAQVVSSIKHPNVVDISDFGTYERGAFYVMEFLKGHTLAHRIDHFGGPLPPEEALTVAVQVCRGLQAAHDLGVVHRDLKPENVFLCQGKGPKDGMVKLLDFGIARAGPKRITVAGALLGTPEYMSPEQARGVDVDHRADLYGLGVILFEMLTGLVPFRSDDVTLTLHSHIHAAPPTLSGVDTKYEYLSRTDKLLRQLLAKHPVERPHDANTAAALLREAIRGDLGSEAAARVARVTQAIGSGAIGEPEVLPDPENAWTDRRMGWDGREAPSQPVEVMLDDPPVRTRRGTPVPLIMTGTAVLAALVTVGTYAALGGFAELSAAADAPITETVTIPAARVPPVVDEPTPPPADAAIAQPVPGGGGDGGAVGIPADAGAAPGGEPLPAPTNAEIDADEEPASSTEANVGKGKHERSKPKGPKTSKTDDAEPARADPPPVREPTESKRPPGKPASKRPHAPDLKEPFGRDADPSGT
jgi:serine/threonine-protein kinase